MSRATTRQRGFSIITAVFLVVVLAALAAFLLRIAATQHAGVALDVLGARAYAAAHSGLEWAAFQAIRNGSCATGPGPALAGELAPFSLQVACTSTTHDQLGTVTTVYRITATASQGSPGSPQYVERQLAMSVATP